MKIFPISDMHTEIWRPSQKYWSTHFKFFKDIDVLVMAGDNGSSINNLIPIAQILLEHPHLEIVYVLGNHDYYGTDYTHAYDSMMWADFSLDRLHVLTGYKYCAWEYKDVVFIGGTLWTDYNKENPQIENAVQHGLNDYRAIIRGSDRKLVDAQFLLNEHYNMKKHIFKQLDKFPDKKRIVVTHHKPFLPECIVDPITYGYCVDLEDKLNECENLPEYWISGHTHRSEWVTRKYKHGEVTFVSNQFGYPSEDPSVTGYHNDCILEI